MNDEMQALIGSIYGVKVVESAYLMVEETTPVRLKGRGIVRHKQCMVPNPGAYRMGDVLLIHPVTMAAWRERIAQGMMDGFEELARQLLLGGGKDLEGWRASIYQRPSPDPEPLEDFSRLWNLRRLR
jgi:hypothetical protein